MKRYVKHTVGTSDALPVRGAHLVAVISLAAVAILTLSSCGGSGDQSATPTPPSIVTPTVPATPVDNTTPLPQQRPADFTVTYEWRAGSMPPPYHYEYTVIVGPGTEGKVVYSPNYPSDNVPIWTETFPVTGEQLDNLYDLVLAKKIFTTNWQQMQNFPVGGSVEWADISAGGKQVSIPSFPQSPTDVAAGYIYGAARRLVPQATWDKLEAQRKEYVDAFGKTPTP